MFTSDEKAYARMAPHMRKVLVIDGQPALVRLLSELLRSIANCQIWSAPTPEKGMTLAREVDPQVIFVEQSAHADGVGFTRALRKSELACRQAPVIMMMHEATAMAIIQARDAGVHEFLRKPFTIKDLERRIEAVTLRSRDWIEAVNYIGPDRRRFNSGDYTGPLKRRSDPSPTPDLAKAGQALKILKSAFLALEAEPMQALRAMRAQVVDLSTAATSLKNLALGAAAKDLGRYLLDEAPARATLEPHVRTLLAWLPEEGEKSLTAA